MLRRYNPEYLDNLISFLLLNLVFIFAYHAFKRNTQVRDVIKLFIAFCVFAFWSSDYAAYKWAFYQHNIEYYKESFYYYLSLISFNSYYLWRAFVWGCATILFYYSVKNFKLNRAITFFVLSLFFLMTFSYARASLAMTVYLYGLSLLLNHNYSKATIARGVFFILLSPFFHRSYYVIVTITPFLFIKFNKKIIYYLIILSPLFFRGIQSLLNYFISSQIELSENMDNLSDSVQSYGNREGIQEKNWKFTMISMLHRTAYFVSYSFILYYSLKKSTNALFDKRMKKILILTTFIIIIASSFLISGIQNYFHEIVGYRFLYMTSLPIVVLLSYMYQQRIITKRMFFINLALPFLYSELWFIGKLIKVPVFW